MADRIPPVRKTPDEILGDLMAGHAAARREGAGKAQKYLQHFAERANSIPNAVKFFLNDLLAEEAFLGNDLETCRTALDRAADYLPVAQTEAAQRFRAYVPSIRLFERGISLALDDGDFDRALSLCHQAIALGLGKAYEAKRASIERML